MLVLNDTINYTVVTMEKSPLSTQQRTLAIEQALTASAEALTIPQVRRRLGHYAGALQHTLQHMSAAPMDEDGYLRDTERGAIPITALHIGEVALRRPKSLFFNRIQQRHIRSKYAPASAKQLIRAHTAHYSTIDTADDLPIFEVPEVEAFVYAHQTAVEDDAYPIYMRGQPVVALNMDASRPAGPVTVLHELIHVLQMNRRPIETTPFTHIATTVQRELEAYYISAQVVLGYHEAGRYQELTKYTSLYDQANFLAIDTIRSANLDGDTRVFTPNDALIAQLSQEGLEVLARDDLQQQWNSRPPIA